MKIVEKKQGQFRSSRQLVRSFESEALKRRTLPEKITDYLASSFGTISFLMLNALLFFFWMFINSGLIPGVTPFDPHPYILLTLLVSLEAIFLAIVVLMSQKREGLTNTLREELHLQINLIAEREITKTLKLLNELHKHHGVKSKPDPELEEMLKDIDTSYIERRLLEQISGNQADLIKEVTKAPTKVLTEVEKTISKEL